MLNMVDILNIIKEHLVNAIDSLADTEIDPNKSMVEYGATSLDVVEIVSNTMRELNVKVPRNELSNIDNIGGLADKILFYAQQQA